MKNEHTIVVNDELITRYLVGEATPDEAVALQEWLEDPDNAIHFEKISVAWNSAYPSKRPRKVRQEPAWEKVSLHIGRPGAQPEKNARVLKPMLSPFRIAASLLILITAGLFYYYFKMVGKANEISLSAGDSSRYIQFPDHSTATLHRHSTIRYPEQFNGIAREIELEGEAFFTITPNSERPFVIHTSVADIKVIGTSFNAALKNGQLEVSVEEGKVMMYTANDSVYLDPGFTGTMKAGERTIRVKDSVDVNNWAYATSLLEFKDTPLKDVISAIEKTYSFTIKPESTTINNCRLTATFDNVSIEKMINLIAETLNLKVTKNGKVFTLEGEGCP